MFCFVSVSLELKVSEGCPDAAQTGNAAPLCLRLEAFVVSLTFCSVWLFTGSKIRPNYLQTHTDAPRIQNAALPLLSQYAVSK